MIATDILRFGMNGIEDGIHRIRLLRHASGLLKDKFGREIPILIHEPEYYGKIARQNIERDGRHQDDPIIILWHKGKTQTAYCHI